MIAARKAVLTEPYDNRPPCHYCGHCMDGCDVVAIFTVPDSMLPKAQKTGNFTLIPNQVAREVLVDNEAKVRGVSLVDTVTKTEQEIPGSRCRRLLRSSRIAALAVEFALATIP